MFKNDIITGGENAIYLRPDKKYVVLEVIEDVVVVQDEHGNRVTENYDNCEVVEQYHSCTPVQSSIQVLSW